jgi:hypothetical protein
MRLTLNEETFSIRKVCVSCKRSLQNGKVPQFMTPNQIRCNKSLPNLAKLSKLEERVVSL